MEFEGSSPYTQEPATCPYPESHKSSPCLPNRLFEDYLISSYLHLRPPPKKTLYYHIKHKTLK
jgi:hypothetical protein